MIFCLGLLNKYRSNFIVCCLFRLRTFTYIQFVISSHNQDFRFWVESHGDNVNDVLILSQIEN